MIKNSSLQKDGFLVVDFPLDPVVLEFLEKENWQDLDRYFLEISKPKAPLFLFLLHYLDFTILEHIIAIRSAPDDEDGIWHDDGSRLLGFSLSLNLYPERILGGKLSFKKKNEVNSTVFPPQPYGRMILFLSGIYGYEHQVSAVTQGQRIVIAGWCQ